MIIYFPFQYVCVVVVVVVVGQSVGILLSSHWVVSEDASMLLPRKGANG